MASRVWALQPVLAEPNRNGSVRNQSERADDALRVVSSDRFGPFLWQNKTAKTRLNRFLWPDKTEALHLVPEFFDSILVSRPSCAKVGNTPAHRLVASRQPVLAKPKAPLTCASLGVDPMRATNLAGLVAF
jgi:hypothetical protein